MTDFALPRHDARTLIIMRHAEADWGLDDFNRPLTRHGSEQAQRAGEWLKEKGLIPEMLVSSAALRTRQTTTWVSDALGEKAPTASLDERLYNAPASALLTAINRTPAGVQSLMLIAHLPGVQDAALQLARPDSEYEALRDASYGYAPSSLTVFEVSSDWDQLIEGEARLTHFASF